MNSTHTPSAGASRPLQLRPSQPHEHREKCCGILARRLRPAARALALGICIGSMVWFALPSARADWTLEIPQAASSKSSIPRLLRIELPGAAPRDTYVEATTKSAGVLRAQVIPGTSQQYFLQTPSGFSGRLRVQRPTRRAALPIQMSTNDHRIEFKSSGKILMGFQSEAGTFPRPDIKPIFRRGGYFHPLVTPSGRWVTDDFPTNHVHHHGVWFAWTKTEFDGRSPDFWNMGDGKGRVEFAELKRLDLGPLFAGLDLRNRYVDLTSGTAIEVLSETWEARVIAPWSDQSARILDLSVSQVCSTSQPLKLPEYRYGGAGLRGHGSWDGTDHAHFLTSNGETDRVKAHATRARWCAMWGFVEGKSCGIAVLAHPSNFRAPEPIRVHPSEPFLNFAPSQAGDFEIKPGSTHRMNYRYVVFDGEPDREAIEQAWNDYAAAPLKSLPEPQ